MLGTRSVKRLGVTAPLESVPDFPLTHPLASLSLEDYNGKNQWHAP